MSICSCEDSQHFRVTGEVIDRPADTDPDVLGTGTKQVRVRCSECGGKVAYIGSDLLTVLGIPEEEIVPCRNLNEYEQVRLKVDLQ